MAVIKNMRQWLQARQNAVDQAKLDFPNKGVEVFHYAEINRVLDAYTGGKRRMVNEVIPHVDIDYVSYSAYDTQHFSPQGFKNILDYIEGALLPKTVPTAKRVIIGEFGRPSDAFQFNDSLHESANRQIFRNALQWCSPYVLYWEMYNNEVRSGQQRGFWLIDSANQKTTLYRSLQYFYQNAENWVYNYALRNGRAPTSCEYSSWADSVLQEPITSVFETRLNQAELSKSRFMFHLSPNPSPNGIYQVQASQEGFRYRIINLNGKEVHAADIQTKNALFKLDHKGLYLLIIEKDGELYPIRILR